MSALETLADKAQAASRRLAGQGGLKGKLAEELADDAEFLRKLKPSLIQARMRGEAPTDQKPGTPAPRAAAPATGGAPPPPSPTAQTEVRPAKGKTKAKKARSGPNPFVVAGAALAVGILTAKIIDWRGHAHPRD